MERTFGENTWRDPSDKNKIYRETIMTLSYLC